MTGTSHIGDWRFLYVFLYIQFFQTNWGRKVEVLKCSIPFSTSSVHKRFQHWYFLFPHAQLRNDDIVYAVDYYYATYFVTLNYMWLLVGWLLVGWLLVGWLLVGWLLWKAWQQCYEISPPPPNSRFTSKWTVYSLLAGEDMQVCTDCKHMEHHISYCTQISINLVDTLIHKDESIHCRRKFFFSYIALVLPQQI